MTLLSAISSLRSLGSGRKTTRKRSEVTSYEVPDDSDEKSEETGPDGGIEAHVKAVKAAVKRILAVKVNSKGIDELIKAITEINEQENIAAVPFKEIERIKNDGETDDVTRDRAAEALDNILQYGIKVQDHKKNAEKVLYGLIFEKISHVSKLAKRAEELTKAHDTDIGNARTALVSTQKDAKLAADSARRGSRVLVKYSRIEPDTTQLDVYLHAIDECIANLKQRESDLLGKSKSNEAEADRLYKSAQDAVQEAQKIANSGANKQLVADAYTNAWYAVDQAVGEISELVNRDKSNKELGAISDKAGKLHTRIQELATKAREADRAERDERDQIVIDAIEALRRANKILEEARNDATGDKLRSAHEEIEGESQTIGAKLTLSLVKTHEETKKRIETIIAQVNEVKKKALELSSDKGGGVDVPTESDSNYIDALNEEHNRYYLLCEKANELIGSLETANDLKSIADNVSDLIKALDAVPRVSSYTSEVKRLHAKYENSKDEEASKKVRRLLASTEETNGMCTRVTDEAEIVLRQYVKKLCDGILKEARYAGGNVATGFVRKASSTKGLLMEKQKSFVEEIGELSIPTEGPGDTPFQSLDDNAGYGLRAKGVIDYAFARALVLDEARNETQTRNPQLAYDLSGLGREVEDYIKTSHNALTYHVNPSALAQTTGLSVFWQIGNSCAKHALFNLLEYSHVIIKARTLLTRTSEWDGSDYGKKQRLSDCNGFLEKACKELEKIYNSIPDGAMSKGVDSDVERSAKMESTCRPDETTEAPIGVFPIAIDAYNTSHPYFDFGLAVSGYEKATPIEKLIGGKDTWIHTVTNKAEWKTAIDSVDGTIAGIILRYDKPSAHYLSLVRMDEDMYAVLDSMYEHYEKQEPVQQKADSDPEKKKEKKARKEETLEKVSCPFADKYKIYETVTKFLKNANEAHTAGTFFVVFVIFTERLQEKLYEKVINAGKTGYGGPRVAAIPGYRRLFDEVFLMKKYIEYANYDKLPGVVLKPIGGPIRWMAKSLQDAGRLVKAASYLISISRDQDPGTLITNKTKDKSDTDVLKLLRRSLSNGQKLELYHNKLGVPIPKPTSFGRIMKRKQSAVVPVRRCTSFGAYVAHSAKVHDRGPYAGHMARYR